MARGRVVHLMIDHHDPERLVPFWCGLRNELCLVQARG